MKLKNRSNRNNKRKGMAAVWMAFFFFFILGIMALMLDFGRAYLAVHQVQNAADAAALAGVRFVPLVYDPNSGSADPLIAKQYAQDYGLRHAAAGEPVFLDTATSVDPADYKYLDSKGNEFEIPFFPPFLMLPL